MIGYPTPSPYYVGTDREFGGRILASDGSITTPSIARKNDPRNGMSFTSDQVRINTSGSVNTYLNGAFKASLTGSADGNGIMLTRDGVLSWANSTAESANGDLKLQRDAANVLALRNSTTAQTLRIYNTYTDASNYRRLEVSDHSIFMFGLGTGAAWSTDFDLGTASNATGKLNFWTANQNRWAIDGSGHLIAATDNTYDIGASGATRPRSIYVGTNVTVGGQVLAAAGTSTAPGLSFSAEASMGLSRAGAGYMDICQNGTYIRLGGGEIDIGSKTIRWGAGIGIGDAALVRDAAGVLAQRDGVNAQQFNVYNTYTNASSYERMALQWGGNEFYLIQQKAGAGSDRKLNIRSLGALGLGAGGGESWIISTSGYLSAQGNLNIWNGTSALATNATAGFLGVNSCAGTPSGTPASIPTGQIPLVYDSTNDKLYAYRGGTWRSVTFA